MMGNVWEWTEALHGFGDYRCHRGGAAIYDTYDLGEIYIPSSIFRGGDEPYYENTGFVGFRVVEVPVIPAPSALALVGIGVGFVGWLRRRKAV